MDVPQLLHETPRGVRADIIPYIMAGLNMLAGTMLARQFLSPQTLLVSLLLIVIGVPSSLFFFRRFQRQRIILNLIVMIPLLILTWTLVHDLPGLQLDWQNLLESIASRQTTDLLIAILHIFVIIAAGRAFLLVSSRDITQSPMPTLFIFLLIAIAPPDMRPTGRDIDILVCLLVMAGTSLYLFSLVHCQLWFTRHTPIGVQWQLVTRVIIASVLLFLVAIPIGFALRPYNMYTMERFFPHRYAHAFRLPGWPNGRMGLTAQSQIDMGGDRWLTGRQVMMTVVVDKPTDLLWRASSYDTYQNGEWRSTLPERALTRTFSATRPRSFVTIPPNAFSEDPGILEALREGKMSLNENASDLVTQGYEISAFAFGTEFPMYGAFQIYQISARPDAYAKIFVANDGGVTVPSHSAAPTGMAEYSVTSLVKPSPLQLKLAVNPPLDPQLSALYLNMPAEIADPIRLKAQAILASDQLTTQSNPWLIVRAFEDYLRENYLYTLHPSPPKEGEDPIVDFLFTQKQGYCNYFSGAMVMLCRSVHIPARFVVGFATGERADDDANVPAGKIAYSVTADDAHSWVEAYLPRYGWYTSDPTAGSIEVTPFWSRSWNFFSAAVASVKNTVQKLISALQQNVRVRAFTSLGIAALLALVAVLLLARRERPPTLPRQSFTPEEARHSIIDSYLRLQRWLDMWGITKPRGNTAREFASLIRQLNAAMGETVDELSALYIRARYSDLPLEDPDARRAIILLQQLWEQWKVERKHLNLDAIAALAEREELAAMR